MLPITRRPGRERLLFPCKETDDRRALFGSRRGVVFEQDPVGLSIQVLVVDDSQTVERTQQFVRLVAELPIDLRGCVTMKSLNDQEATRAKRFDESLSEFRRVHSETVLPPLGVVGLNPTAWHDTT